MELFYLENTKFIAKCPECSEIIKFKIDFENFLVSVECKNGHNKGDLLYNDFQDNYIKSSQLYKANCHQCFKYLNEDKNNYKCQICNKLFCSKCIKKHTIETAHNSLINFFHQYQLCQKHNQKYSYYCQNCKNNICDKCKNTHKKHSIKSILNILPNKKKFVSVRKCSKEFEYKIDEISLKIKNYKNEIEKRFIEIEGFLQFLKNICNNLLKNFNSNYFDYYNFENFNYLCDSLKNEDIFNFDRYKNYLFMNKDKSKNIEIEKPGKTRKEILNEIKNNRRENEINYNYIPNLNKLEYLKDNIFYVFDKAFIKFFKFENFSFNSIMYYDLGKFRVYNINPAKFSNKILLNFEYKKNIKILEYDLSQKTFNILKKDIKENQPGYPRHFYKYMDNSNGNILTQDNNGTAIWEIDSKNNYIKKSTISYAQISLFNINEKLFSFQDNEYTIYFYDTKNYICNKKIKYDKKLDFIGIINNEIIVYGGGYGNIIILFDMKYLEIIKFMDNNRYFHCIKIKGNYLLLFYMEKDNKLKIIKKQYDIKKKEFKNDGIVEKESKLNNFSNVLITDIGYIAILNYNIMIILNI